MLPTPSPCPAHHAVRCVVIGVALAVWVLVEADLGGQSLSLLLGTLESPGHSGFLWREMLPRCARSLTLVVTASTFAAACGTLLTFAAASANLWLARLLGWIGQWLAAVPAAGAAWCCMAWLVNDRHLPVESLIPYAPPVEQDTWRMALGRTLYSWAVPFWLMALPLTGLWVSDLSERLCRHWPLSNAVELNARGVRGFHLQWHHWLRVAWTPLVDRWLRLCFTGLAFSAAVEGVFGLRGWGGFVAGLFAVDSSAEGWRSTLPVNLAAFVYTGSLMMGALCALAGAVRRWRQRGVSGDEGLEHQSFGQHASPSPGALLAAWLAPLVLVLLAVQPEPADWMKAVLGPWLQSLLPVGWVEPLNRLLPALLSDAAWACQTALKAGALSVVFGTLAWVIRRALRRPLPRFEWLSGLAWSPLLLLAWTTPRFLPFWHGMVMFVAVADGANGWRARCAMLEGSGYGLASKCLGSLAGQSLWRHGRSLLLPWLSGWMLRVAGTVVVWRTFAASVWLPASKGKAIIDHDLSSFGEHIAFARDTILSDPETMLWPTLLASLLVWGFWRLGSVAGASRDLPRIAGCNLPPPP